MKPILGEPMLWRQIQRISRAAMIDKLVVATSLDPSDDEIVEFCASRNVACFRGSLTDVLDRYYQAANVFGPADHIVRLTADCPLTDWEVIDAVIRLHLEKGADYTSNTLVRTYPNGLDVEVMAMAALDKAWREAEALSDREHVTSYIYARPLAFSLANLALDSDLSHLRWTVDTPDDFTFADYIYSRLYLQTPSFKMTDILACRIMAMGSGL